MSIATRGAERFEVRGIVQGVGFRPFVHRLATELGLAGHVGNDSSRVFVEAAGHPDLLDEFAWRLAAEAPPLARVDAVDRRPSRAALASSTFSIAPSESVDGSRTLVPPDTAVCVDCQAEMADPNDRRFGHPFITCTNCGPRFTIITDLPYDRPNTTMAGFEMCRACHAEYADPADRRYHAQPIGCHDCGPSLTWKTAHGESPQGSGPAIDAARAALDSGQIVAIKGLGGYHLACDANNAAAIARLRERKHRPDKPFAVMVADLDAARRIAKVGRAEAELLAAPAAPVVLLARRDQPELVGVAPGNPMIGVMLAYAPLHHLLLAGRSAPLVMTSANLAGEPIAWRDADIEAQLGPIADALLTHDRPIATPCDDSVVRMVDGDLLPVRRARGYAPIPVRFSGAKRAVLAVGGELKNAFCVASRDHAWVGQHIGDMGSLATLSAFEQGIDRFSRMYAISPQVVAADSHPGYTVSRWAHRNHCDKVVEVQHHHAHVAAVMAEHELVPDEPVLGFAFDGTGYGLDGAIWGGEVLVATAADADRVAHLSAIDLPGGDAAIEHPCRVALAHLHAAGIEWADDLAPVQAMTDVERAMLARQLATGFGCVATTSMGRLFDAVASLLGLRHHISYEAQAAIELEAMARPATAPRKYRLELDGPTINPAVMLEAIVADIGAGNEPADVAAGFHQAVVDLIVELAAARPHLPVVLSGGVFQNALLVAGASEALRNSDHRVYTHRIVPPNDGGLALGQAYIAAHRP